MVCFRCKKLRFAKEPPVPIFPVGSYPPKIADANGIMATVKIIREL